MPQNVPVDGQVSIKNAKQMPKTYYGLHFYPGVAEYPGIANDGITPNRILVTEDAIRNMEPSFSGCPVYVEHIDGPPRLATLEYEADGYVVESFFNEADGKHWAKLLIVSDKGHEALAKGWKLSNAYKPNVIPKNGVWNSIPYQHEVVGGHFEHMALVERPRYNESVILTPQEFAAYNESCRKALARVDNAAAAAPDEKNSLIPPPKKGAFSMLGLFKKTPVETENDTLVTLKNGRTVTLEQLIAIANADEGTESEPTDVAGAGINEDEKKYEKDGAKEEAKPKDKADEGEEKSEAGEEKEVEGAQGEGEFETKDAVQLANLDHAVMLNGKETKLSDMVADYSRMSQCMNALSEHFSKMPKKEEGALQGQLNSETKPVAAPAVENSQADSDDDFMSGILENKGKGSGISHFDSLLNAEVEAPAPKAAPAPVATSGVALGKQRYGG